jgi:hypothetical protein
MLPVLTIVDDFLPTNEFLEIRDAVRAQGFATVEVQEQPGTCAPKVPYENVNLSKEYEHSFSRGLAHLYGRSIEMELQAFRSGHRGSQLHNKVHADHCCAQLAAVFYMNDLQDCCGGTAFWRHKRWGWEMMPTEAQMAKVGYTLPELSADWHNEDAWQLVTIAGMKPNRIITYPTHAFHSRYPFEGFGEGEKSRLIWCGFFNLI